MYAVYVLEDTWRLRATFSTRNSADIFRRSPCRSRAPRQGVPHGGDAEEGGMKSPIPAAKSAEQVPILYQNPFGDGKLFLRVPSQGSPFHSETTRIATLSSRQDSPVWINSVEKLARRCFL